MNLKIYPIILFIVSLFAAFVSQGQENSNKFDRSAYYAAMASDKLAPVDDLLKSLEHVSFDSKKAFVGALLMKKAGLVSGLNNKLSTFKDGHAKLEDEIKKDSENAEFRFLRLMIQENAPAILNYSSNKEDDKKMILKSYKGMSATVQKAITDYSKRSKVLKPSDF